MSGCGQLKLYRRLAEETRPYWRYLLLIFLLGLLSPPLALLISHPVLPPGAYRPLRS